MTSTETPHLIHPGAVNGARDCIAAIMVSTDAIDHVFVGIEAGVLEDKLRWDLLRAQRNSEESGAKCDE